MKKIFLILILGLLLTSCFWWKWDIESSDKIKDKKEEKQIKKLSFSIPKNELEKEINLKEKKLNLTNKNELLNLVKKYLQYWDSYYKEKVFANKALKLLNTMNEEFIVEYLKWYAYEIQAKYEKALIQYNKVLAFENISKEQKIKALNQKGHVFDLKWDLEKANILYLEAEKLDWENLKTMLNRWRYESRIYNYEISKKYFEKVLEKTNNRYLKAEIYYNLSLYYKDSYKLDEAIKNAKLWISFNKDYPNNYLSLWVLYILMNWDFLDKAPKELNKAIELYPNSSTAYKYLWIYYYKKDNFDKAIENFIKQIETSNKDILLMANDKEKIKIAWEYDLARSYALKWDIKNSVKYLNKVLNGKNDLYYSWFLLDYINNDWDFRKILNNDLFKKEVKDILIKYNK